MKGSIQTIVQRGSRMSFEHLNSAATTNMTSVVGRETNAPGNTKRNSMGRDRYFLWIFERMGSLAGKLGAVGTTFRLGVVNRLGFGVGLAKDEEMRRF